MQCEYSTAVLLYSVYMHCTAARHKKFLCRAWYAVFEPGMRASTHYRIGYFSGAVARSGPVYGLVRRDPRRFNSCLGGVRRA